MFSLQLLLQERRLQQRGGRSAFTQACFLPTSSDVYVRALHAWIENHGGEPFPGRSLPPRLGVDALMERQQAHTSHCRACSGAQRGLRRLRPWLQLFTGLALVSTAALAGAALAGGVGLGAGWLPCIGAGLLSLAGWQGLAQLERWLEGLSRGASLPPRNAPEPGRSETPRPAAVPADRRSARAQDPVT